MSLVLATRQFNKPAFYLGAIALLLILQQLFVRLITDQFLYEVDLSRAPIWPFVLSQIAAGMVFLLLLALIPRLKPSTNLMFFVVCVGLVLRFLMFGTTPILELDFYRYLWDAAVIAQGYNPWLLSPDSIAGNANEALHRLSDDAAIIFDRINYPELTSIYPTLAQVFFWLAYSIDSWNLDAWRAVLLIADLFTLTLLFRLLDVLSRSRLWSLIYWWNPLVVHEIYNSAHMDVLLLPFLLFAFLCLLKHRYLLASTFIALAAAIKLWPLLLLPFSLRPIIDRPRQLIACLLAVTIIVGIGFGPLLYSAMSGDSGLLAYSQSWVRNSALFSMFDSIISFTFSIDNGLLSRCLITLSLSALVLYLNRKVITDQSELMAKICWVIAALFLLSPTQFPWYTLWFAPLLCFYPQPALLLLSALMPIYYLRFYWSLRGNAEIFDGLVIWLQYLPVYLLLLVAYVQRRNSLKLVSSRV